MGRRGTTRSVGAAQAGLNTALGDEGWFRPRPAGTDAAIAVIGEAVRPKAGFRFGTDIAIALDAASPEFFADGVYSLEGKEALQRRSRPVLREARRRLFVSDRGRLRRGRLGRLGQRLAAIGDKVQLVGDDLFVTNPERLAWASRRALPTALLVKVNQIGTLTETLDAVELAPLLQLQDDDGHRCSGETEDTTIADLAVAVGSGQIQDRCPARSERVAKVQPAAAHRGRVWAMRHYAGDACLPRFRQVHD